ncbi:MAG: phosphatase PAP2 family protein [Bacteroidota bacterium]
MNAGKSNFRYFLYPVILFWILGFSLLFLKGYQGSFLYLNSHFATFLDFPFFLLTHIGDTLLVLALLVFFWSKNKLDLLLTIIIAVLLSGLLVQLMKLHFFDDWKRPQIIFFHHIPPIHTYSTYHLFDNSFPSGHSNTIACVFTIFAFAYRFLHKIVLLSFGFIALLICYTRVYLGVHFFGDILVGSLIGVCIALLIIHFIHPYLKNKLGQLIISKNLNLSLQLLGVLLFILSIYLIYRDL